MKLKFLLIILLVLPLIYSCSGPTTKIQDEYVELVTTDGDTILINVDITGSGGTIIKYKTPR